MKPLLFGLSHLALPLLGFGAAFHPSVRSLSLLARASAALALGYVALTVTAVAASTVGVSWSLPVLSLPPLLISCVLCRAWRLRPAPPRRPFRPTRAAAVIAAAAGGVGFVQLVWSLVTAAATSKDFLLFWGVKAARFAQARTIDSSLLRWPYFSHAVPDYPPAVPVVQAWSALWSGELQWRVIPVTAALWAIAASPLLLELLRRSASDDHAAAVTGFWLSAVCISLAYSFSGGGAEAPLLFFETLAVVALLVEPAEPSPFRFLPALMLAGAVLTKVEGSVAALLIAAGVSARDFADPRRRAANRPAALIAAARRLLLGPVAALSVWLLFQATHGLTVGFRFHGALLTLHSRFFPQILGGVPRNLGAGTLGLSWAIPAVLLIAARPNLRPLLPALALTVGLLLFLTFDYLHDDRDPSERIRWTAPRVSQPALSALILAAGVATARRSSGSVPRPLEPSAVG